MVDRAELDRQLRAELEVEVAQPDGQVLQILGEVMQVESEGRLHLNHDTDLLPGHPDQVHDRHARLDVFEQADDLERREHRSVELVVAHDRDLKHADGRVFDAAELLVDEHGHPIAEDVLREPVLLQRPGDDEHRRHADARELEKCLTRHHHERDDRLEAGLVKGLHEGLAVAERLGEGGDVEFAHEGHACTCFHFRIVRTYLLHFHTEGMYIIL